MEIIAIYLLSLFGLAFGRSKTLRSLREHFSVEQPISPCQSGWYWDEEHQLCYKTIHNVDYSEAVKACNELEASVVKVDSKSKNQVILELTRSGAPNDWHHGNLLIGAKKQSGTFRWPDQSHVKYTNWAANEPNNLGEGEHCVWMYTDRTIGFEDEDDSYIGQWNDMPCESKQRISVCEKVAMIVNGNRSNDDNRLGNGWDSDEE